MSGPLPAARRGSLEYHAHATPAARALCEERRSLTYGEWDDGANRLAAFLDAHGVGSGDRVAVCMSNRLEWFIAQAATAKLDALVVPVSPRLTPAEVHYIVADSQARAFLFDAEDADPLARVWTDVPRCDGDDGPRSVVRCAVSVQPTGRADVVDFERALPAAAPRRIARSGPRSIVYTSGTTGRPRGVVGSRGVGTRKATAGNGRGEQTAARTVHVPPRNLLGAPLVHAAGQASAQATVHAGGTVFIMPRFDPEQALRMIDRERITVSFLVPTMLNRIVSLPQDVLARYDVSSIQAIYTGASPCPYAVKEKVIAYFGDHCLFESYGTTEVGLVARLTPRDQLRKPGSCGRLLEGVTVRLIDGSGRDVPQGESGELLVRTPLMIDHYLNEGAPAALRDGFFATGDVGRFDDDGYLYIVDRKKDMIIAGGINIYPAEIESVLREHHAVFDVAVFGVPDPDRGEQVYAVVESAPDERVTEHELLAFARDRLASYKRPRAIDVVEKLPRNATGKVLKRELRAPFWASSGKAI